MYSESDGNCSEYDHGCEVMGAGAKKTNKNKRKTGEKAAAKRRTQKKSNDILPDIVTKKKPATKGLAAKKVAQKVVPKAAAAKKKVPIGTKTSAPNIIENLQNDADPNEATILTRKRDKPPPTPRQSNRRVLMSDGSINKILFTPATGKTSSKIVASTSVGSDIDITTPKRNIT